MDSLVAHLGSIGMEPQDLPRHAAMPRASVLVALFLRSREPHMLLTKRTMKLKSHSGQVCFPGGKQDPEDLGDDVVTALREAHEEVGLDASHIQPLCRLVPIESVTGLCVTPIVAYISKSIEPCSLALSEHEVEAAFCVPVSYFFDEKNCASKQNAEWSGGIFCMRTYFFQSNNGNFKIWGLTAHIAHQVAEIAMGTARVCPLVVNKVKQEMNMSGHLFRLEGSSTRPFWSRYFFVCNGQMLHQYESEHEASRKSSSANKKNRPRLKYCQVIVADSGQNNKYAFLVSAWDGRVKWLLAAQEKEDRRRWMRILVHYSHEIA